MPTTNAGASGVAVVARDLPADTWKWFLGITVVLAIVYGALPVTIWKEPLYDLLVMSAFVVIWFGNLRYQPARHNQWLVLLVAMGCIAAAEWVWFANDVRNINPLPGWGELLDLVGRALLLFALARLSSSRGQLRDRLALLDAGVVGAAVAVLAWAFMFSRLFYRADLRVLERLTSAVYVAFDLSLLVGFLLLLSGGARRGTTALRLVTVGIGILVVADFVWLTLLAHDDYTFGLATDALWPIAYCTIAAAALHPSMRDLTRGSAVATSPAGRRLLLLPIAVIALPAGGLVANVFKISLSLLDDVVIGLGTLAIGAVVAARFLGLMRFVENAADARGRYRTEALVRESLDIVAIVDAGGLVTYVSPPLERVLGWPTELAIGRRVDALVFPGDRALADQYFARVIGSAFGTPFTFTMDMRARDGRPVLMEVACVNRLDDAEINGIIVSARDISERTRLEHEVTYYALHDRLTDLANRSLLLDHIDLAMRQRRAARGALFVLDLDDFQAINDGLGHAAGDELLVSVGERLRMCVRPGDTLARLNGDEFAVYFAAFDPDDAAATAQRLLDVLRLPLAAGTHEISIGASIGIRLLGPDETAAESLRDADIAMYSAKWAGKGGWRVFAPEMGVQATRRAGLIAELPGAWRRDEMRVHYQPIVDMPSGQIRGAEALLRWTHPDFGPVSPDEFVPLAEQTGIVREFGLEVLREATRAAAGWRAGGIPDFYVSVNVSPVQLDDALVDVVAGILTAADLDAGALLIEITENVVLSNVEASLRVLASLRTLGIRIAIDDFGTGYSSLAYAQRFPIDLVKIDQTFTRELDARHAGMIPTIIGLAHAMGATLVAEGVETSEQATELVRLGCVLAQGYLYAPAVPGDAMAVMVSGGTIAAGGAYAASGRRA